MEYLGAEQKNTVWSWCGVNRDEHKVYLSVWTDTRAKRDGYLEASYIIQEPHWGIDEDTGKRQPARNDHDEKLSMIFDEGYEAYGYFTSLRIPKLFLVRSSILERLLSFLLQLKTLHDGTIIGYPPATNRHKLELFMSWEFCLSIPGLAHACLAR